MKNLYHINSNFTILNKKDFLKKKNIILNPCGEIIQDEIKSINIDSKLDLDLSRFSEVLVHRPATCAIVCGANS